MRGRHEGRVAIVTGSSRGIGRAIAVRLAEEGAAVVLNSRNAEPLDDVVAEIAARGGQAVAVPLGISRPEAAAALVEAAVTSFGRIDLVVNNVALSPHYGPLLEATEAAVTKTMTGNTWPAISLVQAAMAAGLGTDGGAVLNISTIGAQQTQPLASLYVAAKAALESLTRALAHELAPHGVRVNAIAPGVVRTQTSAVLWEGDRAAAETRLVPLGRLGEPEDIAPAAAFLLSDEASWITGATLVVDGGRMLVGAERADLIGAPPDPRP